MPDEPSRHLEGERVEEDLLGGLEEEAPSPGPERLARLLLGAASGGVLGLILAGLLGSMFQGGNISFGLLATLVVVVAAGMATLNMRRRDAGLPPPPRAVWAAVLSAAALLVSLGVYLGQAAYIQSVAGRSEQVTLPLAVWPVASGVLLVALLLAGGGVLLSLLGWADLARERGRYAGGRWLFHAVLTAAASFGLAGACYFMGNGFSFGG